MRKTWCGTALSLQIVAGACCAVAGAPDAPVWRQDLTHLRDDMQAVEQCLARAEADPQRERACIDVFPELCERGVPAEAVNTTLFQRQCGWRAIAAWEDVLAKTAKELEAALRTEERGPFARSVKAWDAFVDANVRSRAAEFEGGSFQGVIAGQIRARMTAERTLELRQWLHAREEE